MRLARRRPAVPPDVLAAARLERGDRVLAHGHDGDRWLLGTRQGLVVVENGSVVGRLPWEQVQAAGWERDSETFTLSEVGEFGRPRATYSFHLESPDLLLQLVRERVTASVVLQRGVQVSGSRGVKVIGRRPPEGGPITWMHEYDAGLDPDDPAVAEAAATLLAQARSDVGE